MSNCYLASHMAPFIALDFARLHAGGFPSITQGSSNQSFHVETLTAMYRRMHVEGCKICIN